NGMRKPEEPAWMLAKGAAGTGKVPSAPVRQADEGSEGTALAARGQPAPERHQTALSPHA
ncbi:hypothetical protein VH86_05530, partial [Pantoea sp. BL1]|uniref:hypothetical protein n=1 Tax=Pantoea sp. BL1 TaxID=1628190 RepID=UPI0005F86B02